jgi:hypothetical protein
MWSLRIDPSLSCKKSVEEVWMMIYDVSPARADGMSQTLFEAQAVASSLEALGPNCNYF